MIRGVLVTGLLVQVLAAAASAADDARLRTIPYDAGRIYRIRGYVGFQIDLEFDASEAFLGMGAGDIEAVGYAASGNHLFIKPRASHVRTNLTILTTRRAYHVEYRVVSAEPPGDRSTDVVYTIRFTYTGDLPAATLTAQPPSSDVASSERSGADLNRDYWFCGSSSLRPVAAYDDGVSLHLQFSPSAEMPAFFSLDEDGSESLVNFTVQDGEVVIQRLARRILLRRGRLKGCVVNRSYAGAGHTLSSGTTLTDTERALRGDR